MTLPILCLSLTLYFGYKKGVWDVYKYMYSMNGRSHVKTCCKILETGRTFVKTYMTQYVFHNSYKIARHVYDIEYTIHLKTFRIRVHYKRGPSRFRGFFVNDKDITNEMMSYIGPNDDFHNQKYTSLMFGYPHIRIRYEDGEEREFGGDEVFTIS